MNPQMLIIEEVSNSEKEISGKQTIHNQIGIFIHLHYLDTLERYFRYMDIVPNEVPIVVSTSSWDVKSKLQEYVHIRKKKKIEIVYKKIEDGILRPF